ncbi:AAA family ATPase [Colwellia sp. BRX10-3]|uniref:AAA family ATPase n=1 Tax=Colwellia sp. BRX10-3 TaxID=2759844 RepID=UPI0015F55881|nr:AAA family ATPase [Colwellia sp. BRX10-3]MBA6390707.1 AAA family ATPase [Colwellia sp. BRX10-3]
MSIKKISNIIDLPDSKPLEQEEVITKKQSLPLHINALVICTSDDTKFALANQFSLINNLHIEFSKQLPKQFSQFDLVMLAMGKDSTNIKIVIEQLAKEHIPTLLLGDDIEHDVIRTAMQFNVQDVITLATVEQELVNTLTVCANKILKQKKVAPIISIINGKSGSGASFISGCLGEITADLCQDEIVLLDADLHYGSLADSLNFKADYFLNDALNDIESLDNTAIKSMMTKRKNLSLLTSKTYAQLDSEQNKNFVHLEQLLWKIKLNHDLVLADLSRGLDVLTLPLVLLSSQILIVVQQNIVSLRETKALIHQLTDRMGINKSLIKIIVNRHSKQVTNITLDDIKNVLAINDIFCVSNNYQLASSCTDLGSPLSKLSDNKIIHKDICCIIEQIFPVDIAVEKAGFFSNILRKAHDFIRYESR